MKCGCLAYKEAKYTMQAHFGEASFFSMLLVKCKSTGTHYMVIGGPREGASHKLCSIWD